MGLDLLQLEKLGTLVFQRGVIALIFLYQRSPFLFHCREGKGFVSLPRLIQLPAGEVKQLNIAIIVQLALLALFLP